MEPYDDSRRIVDLVASFGSKNPPSGQHKRKNTAAARAKTGSSTSSQGQRLEANGLRPTHCVGRLENIAPSCLDASQIYRILSMQFDSLAQGSVPSDERFMDCWVAGSYCRHTRTRLLCH